MEHLKDKQHYIDQYDLFTIKKCLEAIERWRSAYAKYLDDEQAKEIPIAEKAKFFNWIAQQEIFTIMAPRYKLKEETIQKWMVNDQIKQDQYDNTPEPKRIVCPKCKKLMHVRFKQLETLSDPLRMMFLFECTCKKKRWIYEDGTEWESTPILCTKCKKEVEMIPIKETTEKIVWKTTCSSCGFTETHTDELGKQRAEWKRKEDEDKQLLARYRERFCSEKEGKESLEYIEALPVAKEVFDEQVKKFDSFAYQMVSQLKKISIIELEKLLNEIFEKANYIRLSFDKPEIGQHVIVPFTVQETESSRKEQTGIDHLKKLTNEALEGTNWRLMTDGIVARLGYMSGRLKGYEREEDFFKLSGEKKEEQELKIDYETRMKHEGHNVVQLARGMGEVKGIKNVRIRRLKKEPEGFFLESDEGFYSCGICGDTTPGNKIWWNLDGLKCADCQRSIKEGVIPIEIHKNDDIWIKDWQLTSEYDFGINSSTVRKLRRQELLHGRDLKREDGSIYFTVYLIEENKEFLEKYHRKERPKMTITDLLGNKIEL